MSAFEEIFLETHSGKLAARVWGPKDGKRVLALHGWLDNCASFDALAPLLPHCRIVALDLPGHGLSDHRSKGVVYHFVDAVEAVTGVLNQLGWPQASLLGHSMGAGIATLVAGTFPERIEKLALIEGLGPLSYPANEAPHRLARSILQYAVLETKKMPIYSTIKEATIARCKVSGFSERAAASLMERGLKKLTDGFTWRSDPKLTLESPLRMTEEQVLAFIERISCPVALIKAKSGMPFDEEKMLLRRNTLKSLSFHELEGHHHLHLEEPEPVAEILRRFF